MIKVIGVHTSAIGGSSMKGSPLTAGHAWLSLHFENGRDDTIGLWLTDGQMGAVKRFLPLNYLAAAFIHEDILYEVLIGEEKRKNYKSSSSRFYGLDESRKLHAMPCLIHAASWRYEYTCATWVTEKVKQIFGEVFATGELFGLTNTPRRLGSVLASLEAQDPTSLVRPKYPK